MIGLMVNRVIKRLGKLRPMKVLVVPAILAALVTLPGQVSNAITTSTCDPTLVHIPLTGGLELQMWNVIGLGASARRQCEWHLEYNDAMVKLNNACTPNNPCQIAPFTCTTLPVTTIVGTAVICSNCNADATCSCGGPGAIAVWTGTVWACNIIGGGGGGGFCPTGVDDEIQYRLGAACETSAELTFSNDIFGTDDGLAVGSRATDSCSATPVGCVIDADFGQSDCSDVVFSRGYQSTAGAVIVTPTCASPVQTDELGFEGDPLIGGFDGYLLLYNSNDATTGAKLIRDDSRTFEIQNFLHLFRTDAPLACNSNRIGLLYEDLSSNGICRCNGSLWCRIDDAARCGDTGNCDGAFTTTTTIATTTSTSTTTTSTTTSTSTTTTTLSSLLYQVCKTIYGPGAGDDNQDYYAGTPTGSRLVSTGCHCDGTCSTAAQFTWKDRSANPIGLTVGGNLSCQTGANAITFSTFDTGDIDRDLVTGEVLQFDTANTPTSTDFVLICIRFTLL